MSELDNGALLKHEDAMKIESLMRRVFRCEHYEVMGIISNDHIKWHPMDAVIAIFAPLFYQGKLSDVEKGNINNFADHYFAKFYDNDNYEYNETDISEFIYKLNELARNSNLID